MKLLFRHTAFLLGLLVSIALGAMSTPVYLLPMNCAELVPDSGPFMHFFESVASGIAANNRALSKRLFRVLSLRERVAVETGRVGDANPVDPLIRRFLCYYREQKDPLRIISYDDSEFLGYMKKELPNLEKQVDDSVYRVAFEEQSRIEFDRRLQLHQSLIEVVRDEAGREADLVFEKVIESARKKVKLQ